MVGSRQLLLPANKKREPNFQAIQQQLVLITGPPKQLSRDGRNRVKTIDQISADGSLPGWYRGIASRGAAASMRSRSIQGQANLEHMEQTQRRARSSTPSLIRKEPLMLAGAAGSALRTSSGRLLNASGGTVELASRQGRRSASVSSISLDEGTVQEILTNHNGDHSLNSLVVANALAQLSIDRSLLVQIQTKEATQGEMMHSVQAALLRQGAHEALSLLHAERLQLGDELRTAEVKLREVRAIRKHQDRTAAEREQERINLLADRSLAQRQVDSIQESVEHILVQAKLTMQHLHGHTQCVIRKAHTSLSEAKDEVVAEKVKLHAQTMVAESLSNRVMELTVERDTADAAIARQQKQMAELTDELEVRNSLDDVRYEHACNMRDLHHRHQDRREAIVGKWAEDMLGDVLRHTFAQWNVLTRHQQHASTRAKIKAL